MVWSLSAAAAACSHSIGRRQRTRGNERRETSGRSMQLAPVLGGEIDDDETGRRQAFIEPLAPFDIAGGNQGPSQVVKTRIVTNHQQGRGDPVNLSYDREDSVAARVIDTFLVDWCRRHAHSRVYLLPGLPRPL